MHFFGDDAVRYALLTAILLSFSTATAGAERKCGASVAFTVVVPSKLQAESSGQQIRFQSSVPLLIQATESATKRVLWTRPVHVVRPQTVVWDRSGLQSDLILTIVPLY